MRNVSELNNIENSIDVQNADKVINSSRIETQKRGTIYYYSYKRLDTVRGL